jgi:hypothetical protein
VNKDNDGKQQTDMGKNSRERERERERERMRLDHAGKTYRICFWTGLQNDFMRRKLFFFGTVLSGNPFAGDSSFCRYRANGLFLVQY